MNIAPVKKSKKNRPTNKPLRPMSYYLLFGMKYREEHKLTGKISEQARVISEKWNELSESEKKNYKEEYLKNKSVYAAQLEAYKQTDEYIQERMNKGKKGKKDKKNKDDKKKVKRTRTVSGYNVYLSDQFNSFKKEGKKPNLKEHGPIIKNNWQSLSAEQKDFYEKLAQQKTKDNELLRKKEEIGK